MKKVDITCDDCQLDCTIKYKAKKEEIAYCPFCGSEVRVPDSSSLNTVDIEEDDENEDRWESESWEDLDSDDY